MFRRRPRRRGPLRRPGRPLRPGPQQALQKAHRLRENGNYAAAADIFERLANGAQKRGMLRRAPHLYLQAANNRLRASQNQRAETLLYHGLELLANNTQWDALHRVGRRATQEYQQHGLTEEAAKLKRWLDEKLKDHPETPFDPAMRGSTAHKPPKLPAKCEFCGASVRPNEVEWLDQTTAECLYCGSALQAED